MNERKQAGSKGKLILPILAVIVIAVLFKVFNVQVFLTSALDWISGQGLVGAGIYLLLYVLATVFMMPGSILTLGAGVIYGVVWGSILVSLSSTLGATAAFLVGRYFARGWVSKKLKGMTNLRRLILQLPERGGRS